MAASHFQPFPPLETSSKQFAPLSSTLKANTTSQRRPSAHRLAERWLYLQSRPNLQPQRNVQRPLRDLVRLVLAQRPTHPGPRPPPRLGVHRRLALRRKHVRLLPWTRGFRARRVCHFYIAGSVWLESADSVCLVLSAEPPAGLHLGKGWPATVDCVGEHAGCCAAGTRGHGLGCCECAIY